MKPSYILRARRAEVGGLSSTACESPSLSLGRVISTRMWLSMSVSTSALKGGFKLVLSRVVGMSALANCRRVSSSRPLLTRRPRLAER